MRYFKLQLTKPEGDSLFETDFLVDHFELFARQLTAGIVQQGLFREGDGYEVRVIPKTGNNPSEQPVILEKTDVTDDGEGFLDVLFEAVEPPIEQITHLTIQISPQEADKVYRFDARLDALLGLSLLRSIAQSLLDGGDSKDGDHFQFHVSAYGEGKPNIDPVAVITKPVITPPPPPPGEQDEEEILVLSEDAGQMVIEISPEEEEEEIDIVIGSVEELIKPESKSMQDYSDAEPVGQISEQDVPIFLRRGAREQTMKSASASAQAVEEMGGFLLGNVFRDPDTDRLFVEISEAVEADEAQGTAGSLDFDYNVWRQVLDRIDKDFPDKVPVGWYHTHLVSRVAVLPVEEAEGEYMARYFPFFSPQDRFIHRNFFPDPWHVALVIDLRCGWEMFFAWREGAIVPSTGFYLYGE